MGNRSDGDDEVPMTQDEQQDVGSSTRKGWTRFGALSGILGGTLAVIGNLGWFAQLYPANSSLPDQIWSVAVVLLGIGIVAFYAGERKRFGRLAKIGMGLVVLGFIPMVVSSVASAWVPTAGDLTFIAYLLALLVALIGGIVLGIGMLRTDVGSRLAGWLLIAALPIGLPVTIGYFLAVIGEIDHPWIGPEILFALAWIVICSRLWTRRTDTSAAGVEAVSQ